MSASPTFDDGVPVHDGAAHEHHAVARDGGRGRVVDVVHLEDDLTVRRHDDTVSVRQRQRLVVVQDGVEVLNPDRVHRAVQQQPHVVSLQSGLRHKCFWLQTYTEERCAQHLRTLSLVIQKLEIWPQRSNTVHCGGGLTLVLTWLMAIRAGHVYVWGGVVG